jgi:hypothetical protein
MSKANPYVGVESKVTLDGNFFTHDPGKTLRGNVRDMMEALAAEMEKEAKVIIGGAPMPHSTGWSYQRTVGRVVSYQGKRWGTWAVVSANTNGLDRAAAVRTLAAASSIEKRFHPYRRVKSAVYRLRPVLSANLTRNLE